MREVGERGRMWEGGEVGRLNYWGKLGEERVVGLGDWKEVVSRGRG